MIERSLDLTFVWGFVRSSSSDLSESTKGPNIDWIILNETVWRRRAKMFILHILKLFCCFYMITENTQYDFGFLGTRKIWQHHYI